jgi:la-related protein 1
VGGGAAASDPAGGGVAVGVGASPWRKTTPPPAAGEAAVMGAESWPALEEARQKVAPESPAKAGAGSAAGGDSAKGPQGSPPTPPPSQVYNLALVVVCSCAYFYLWDNQVLREFWCKW